MTTPDFSAPSKTSELRAALDEAEAERDEARERCISLEGEIETLIREASERDEYIERLEGA